MFSVSVFWTTVKNKEISDFKPYNILFSFKKHTNNNSSFTPPLVTPWNNISEHDLNGEWELLINVTSIAV